MRRAVLGVLVVTLLAASCGTAAGPGRQGSGGTERHGSSTTATTVVRSTTTSVPSALDTLGPYLTQVAAVGASLKKAAAAVNGDIGAQTLTLSPSTDAAVVAADPTTAGNAIPAGLPPALLAVVMLVQSDLVSRWAALEGFRRLGSTPVARGDQQAQEALTCLANGGTAAASMSADTGALETAAARVPPVTPSASDSQDAADVRLLLQFLEGLNLGCASCGGQRYTTMPAIVWYPAPMPSTISGVPATNGTINGVEFSSSYTADGGWNIQIHAC